VGRGKKKSIRERKGGGGKELERWSTYMPRGEPLFRKRRKRKEGRRGGETSYPGVTGGEKKRAIF